MLGSYLKWKLCLLHHVALSLILSNKKLSGKSLNNILTKIKNIMNILVEIMICLSKYRISFHTDIVKMYSIAQLRQEGCLQCYI